MRWVIVFLLGTGCATSAPWGADQLGDSGDHPAPQSFVANVRASARGWGAIHRDREKARAVYLQKRMWATPALFAAAGLVQINDLDEQWVEDLVTDPILDVDDTNDAADKADIGLYALFGIGLWAPVLFPPRDDVSRWSYLVTSGEAWLITLGLTEGIRAMKLRDRPNGDSSGFISGHTSNAVVFATLLHRYYGWKAGVPAYLGAAAVSIYRIEAGRHFPADVFIGAGLGFYIANLVYEKNLGAGGALLPPDVTMLPIVTSRSVGLSLQWDW